MRIAPPAAKSEIVGEFEGALKVKIAAELVKVLWRAFGDAKRAD